MKPKLLVVLGALVIAGAGAVVGIAAHDGLRLRSVSAQQNASQQPASIPVTQNIIPGSPSAQIQSSSTAPSVPKMVDIGLTRRRHREYEHEHEREHSNYAERENRSPVSSQNGSSPQPPTVSPSQSSQNMVNLGLASGGGDQRGFEGGDGGEGGD